jgi:hypothetical protein
MRVLLIVACTGWCFLLTMAEVNAEGLTEKQLLFEILSETDKPAVKEAIQKYYGTFFDKFSPGQKSDEGIRKAQKAQMNALGFSGIVDMKETESKAESMGEPKIEPKINEVLPVTYVQLNELKNYSEKDQPEKLILRQKAFVVPFEISEKDRNDPSFVQPFTVVVPSRGETESKTPWKVSQSGPSRNFQALVDGRKEIIEQDYKSADYSCKCFMIWIPALKQNLLGDQSSGEFKIKILKDGLGDFKKGQLVAANKVFLELAKEARKNKYNTPIFNPQKPQRP